MDTEVKKYFIQVVPNAKSDSVEEISANVLRVRVSARPIDGEANKKLVEILSKYFKVGKSCVRIEAGQFFRQKIVKIIQ